MAEEYNGKKQARVGPKSSYKTKYPYNKVTISEKGCEFHIDDTPGACRMRIAHFTGTQIEIQHDGKMTMYTAGNQENYHKGGLSVTVDENGDIKIAGHGRNNNDGGAHTTHKGDTDSATGGHSTVFVGGNAKVGIAGDAYMGVVGHMNMNIGKNVNLEAKNMTMKIKGTLTMKAKKIDMNP